MISLRDATAIHHMPSQLRTDILHLEWPQLHWPASLRRTPALMLGLLGGLLLHQTGAGVLATAAALSVGLAGLRQIDGSRLITMLLTTVTMAVCAILGTWSGNHHVLALAVTIVAGFVVGLLTVLNDDVGWIALQGSIALLVATTFPSHGLQALLRGVAILAGGGLQTIILLVAWRLAGVSRLGDEFQVPGGAAPMPAFYHELFRSIGRCLVFTSTSFHFAIHVAITLVIAIELDHQLHLKNGYWLPMTTLVVLKPDFYRTYSGGIERMIGTLAGVLVASAITFALHPAGWVLIVLVGVCGFLSYALLKVNTVLFAGALTSLVVFMIAVSGSSEFVTMEHRLVNTALGCTVALASSALIPRRAH